MFTSKPSYRELALTHQLETHNLSLESTLQELSLYDFQVESSNLGKEVAQTFQANPLIPGVILTEQGKLAGMISRRRFLEQMSRPYGLELFLQRPLKSLYRFAHSEALILAGETPVIAAARRCLERPADLVARYGGEEFVVILPCTPITGAAQVAEAIRQAVRALEIPHKNSPVSCCVTISLGVAGIFPTPETLPTKLIKAADTALYQAKSSGRDRVVLHPPLSQLQFYK